LVERAGVRQRPGSHVIMVSRPEPWPDVIMAAAAAVDRPTVATGSAK
jgi:hypothetical protein